ncbi:MAG: acetate/propionate family kinase [Candidatus Eremiobacteraeota bacterium]|nr:acetate/propionate family kinase [Candidatus Eremiobacteraeota bacterium]
MIVLCLDGGSSSLKFAAYRAAGRNGLRCLTSGTLIGAPDPRAVLGRLLRQVDEKPSAVGHRIVFGGPARTQPVVADDDVLRELEALCPIEPLHLRPEIDLVIAAREALPGTPQVLCFDTAFHESMPDVAKRLPLPGLDPMLRRYGFHGLSYEYVSTVLGDTLGARAIVAHLGSGASLCALRDGAPVDTTMGFSALGGLMMATRPGDLDPGVLLRLMGEGYDATQLSDLLYERAGLAGVSGVSGDMRALLAAAHTDQRARTALELYDYQLLKHAGALVAVLGGLDTLVFTGGVGEHQPEVRANLCRSLRYTGVEIDDEANVRNADVLSTPESGVSVRVVPTDENLTIARHALATFAKGTPSPSRT